MLNLSSAHLREMRANSPKKRLVWVDIGGGTGKRVQRRLICLYMLTNSPSILVISSSAHRHSAYSLSFQHTTRALQTFQLRLPGFNIEAMDRFFPISNFDAVYLVDICEPLLKIARQRFTERGWKNVHVIRQDAASFMLPEPDWSKRSGVFGSLSFVTFSYSLSMVSHPLLPFEIVALRIGI